MSPSPEILSLPSQSLRRRQALLQHVRRLWHWPLSRTLFSFLLLPYILVKLPLLLLGARPSIDLDYAGLGLIAEMLSGGLASLAYAALVLLDAVNSLAPVFHFSLSSAGFGLMALLKTRPLLFGCLACLAATAALATGVAAIKIARLAQHGTRASRIGLCAVAFLIGAADFANGTGQVFRSERAWLNWNIAGSA